MCVWIFLLKKFLEVELLCQSHEPFNFNSILPKRLNIVILMQTIYETVLNQLSVSAVSAGRPTGGVVGKDIVWQWLDTQCPVHHSFLAAGWPQATLHNPRPQMGNPCTLKRFWRQGKIICFTRISYLALGLRPWTSRIDYWLCFPSVWDFGLVRFSNGPSSYSVSSWPSRYSMSGLMPLLATCPSQPTTQTSGKDGGRTQSKWAVLG